jgi:hypothetical protein
MWRAQNQRRQERCPRPVAPESKGKQPESSPPTADAAVWQTSSSALGRPHHRSYPACLHPQAACSGVPRRVRLLRHVAR